MVRGQIHSLAHYDLSEDFKYRQLCHRREYLWCRKLTAGYGKPSARCELALHDHMGTLHSVRTNDGLEHVHASVSIQLPCLTATSFQVIRYGTGWYAYLIQWMLCKPDALFQLLHTSNRYGSGARGRCSVKTGAAAGADTAVRPSAINVLQARAVDSIPRPRARPRRDPNERELSVTITNLAWLATFWLFREGRAATNERERPKQRRVLPARASTVHIWPCPANSCTTHGA